MKSIRSFQKALKTRTFYLVITFDWMIFILFYYKFFFFFLNFVFYIYQDFCFSFLFYFLSFKLFFCIIRCIQYNGCHCIIFAFCCNHKPETTLLTSWWYNQTNCGFGGNRNRKNNNNNNKNVTMIKNHFYQPFDNNFFLFMFCAGAMSS